MSSKVAVTNCELEGFPLGSVRVGQIQEDRKVGFGWERIRYQKEDRYVASPGAISGIVVYGNPTFPNMVLLSMVSRWI